VHGIYGWPGERHIEAQLWRIAGSLTPARRAAEYTQAIMDLGATVCTRARPACGRCPVRNVCHAYVHNAQADLPTRKIKTSLPVKHAIFTIIRNRRGEILLERRPPAGIWGGLWSLPECPVHEDIPAWIKRQFGSTVTGLTEMKPLRHTFSHFHLDIRPYQARLKSAHDTLRDQDGIIWYRPGINKNLGLAAPVKKLLEEAAEADT
jgi:A/G-specific adenine glycosylase